ncbi:MAG: radical SAM protein [Candidatus Nealsonbacteria bacterium]
MKILLINPPSEFKTPVLPLGLASIASYLKNKNGNLDIMVIDAWAEELTYKEIENRAFQTQADIVGIYMVSPRYEKTKSAIEACRKALPESVIIAGGPHPSAVPSETLNDIPQLDICAIGEGEITMDELVNALQNKSDLSGISGLAYRDQNGKTVFTKPRDFIENLDILPFPARELFPLEKYKTHPPYGKKNPYFTMVTSRGCPFHCAYCSKDVFKNRYRSRSPKNVCDEIEELISKYGAQEIQFYDDDFTMDMKRAEEICDEISKRNLKFRWSCLTRVNLVDENLLKKMKKAGCWLVSYGVESGSQKILDSINKGFTINQVISTFELTRRIGLATICYFIIGLPGETKETIRETVDLIKKIRPNFISGGMLTIFPGSRLFNSIRNGEYLGKLRTLKEGENLTGVFAGKGNYMIIENNFTLSELKTIVRNIIRGFYLRPQYILQSMANIRSFSDLNYYLNAGLELIKSIRG